MPTTIEVEGISGAGKTTLIPTIVKFLSEQGLKVLSLKEPGQTKLGNDIRGLLQGEHHGRLSPLTQMFLFLANRCDIHEKYVNNNDVDILLFDRYFGSTIVYQVMAKSKEDTKEYSCFINSCMAKFTGTYNNVHTTILLDCDTEVAYNRIKERQKTETRALHEAKDKDEFIAYNNIIRDRYTQYFYESRNYLNNLVVDANGTKEQTAEEVIRKLTIKVEASKMGI